MDSTQKELLIRAEEQLAAMCVSEALKLFHQAEETGCDADSCAAGRWTCYMLSGDFELAWRESDSIAARGNPDPHRFWDSRPLDGRRVLIRCLHGLGDTIQFIRYAPLVRAKARHLTLEVQPTLKDLLTYSRLADEVITWGEPEPAWDQQIEVVELPRIFRTLPESVPNGVPYLHAPAASLYRRRARAGLIRAGIVWNASNYNPARAIPAEAIAKLLDVPGVEFYSLQAGLERFDLIGHAPPIPQLFSEGECVLTTASLVRTLDLVVTVDTMMAHLAGALGRPVWTLLPYQSDWRWMLNREDTPWYPTMRLIRQNQPGEWEPVISKVKSELAACVDSVQIPV
ncbi:MAG: hypothetical protein JO210_12830 [Acidobacteriaceae bacterium]|nr:hypothetical protein [Acidobacteriaceae bacterium]